MGLLLFQAHVGAGTSANPWFASESFRLTQQGMPFVAKMLPRPPGSFTTDHLSRALWSDSHTNRLANPNLMTPGHLRCP